MDFAPPKQFDKYVEIGVYRVFWCFEKGMCAPIKFLNWKEPNEDREEERLTGKKIVWKL